MAMVVAEDDSGGRLRRLYREGNEWFYSTGLQSDVVIEVDGVLFHLHKFPLISKCGKIVRMANGMQDAQGDVHILLEGCPGGAEGFLIAVSFCYESKVELKPENILMVYLVADFLEMTEEYSENNMLMEAESFMNKEIFQSWNDCISALRSSQNFILEAENLPIIHKCLNALSVMACRDPSLISRPPTFGRLQSPGGSILWNGIHTGARVRSTISDWWFEDVSFLPFPVFKKFIETTYNRGNRSLDISGALMFYAMKYLPGLDRWQNKLGGRRRIIRLPLTSEVVDQKALIEGITELFPENKGKSYCHFLLGFLRLAIIVDVDWSCKESLERKIGMQLELVTLDSLLIPNFSGSDNLYDTDCVERIIRHFLSSQSLKIAPSSASSSYHAIPLSTLINLTRLMDDYLAEVAPDVNLKPQKMQSLLEIFPEYLRELDDGIYRAVDIYFKEHPWIEENEREQICRIMNCRKLSSEACIHALHNRNLPLRVLLQVLYSEQQQLRAIISNYFRNSGTANIVAANANRNANVIANELSGATIERENWLSVTRESQYLRVDMERMQSKVKELENQFMGIKKYMGKFLRRSISR